jgi:hypothetical protein
LIREKNGIYLKPLESRGECYVFKGVGYKQGCDELLDPLVADDLALVPRYTVFATSTTWSVKRWKA